MLIRSEVFSCECCSPEHNIVFKLIEYKDGDRDLIMEVFLCDYLGFWKRLWLGIKYIFGHKTNSGHFDCVMVQREDVDRFMELLKAYKEK